MKFDHFDTDKSGSIEYPEFAAGRHSGFLDPGHTWRFMGVTPIRPFRGVISRVISPVKVVTKSHEPSSRALGYGLGA